METLVNPQLKNFQLLASGVDYRPALAEVQKHNAIWPMMDLRQRLGPAHKDTETIGLRGPPTVTDILNNFESMNYTVFNSFRAVGALLLELTSLIQAREVGRVMLVRLKPQGEILPHKDEGSYARYYARFHFPLRTNEKCMFTVEPPGSAGGLQRFNGESEFSDPHLEHVHMKPGELWWFNHQAVHWVKNDSTIPRIHLIFDACAPGFTGALSCPAQ